MISKYVLDKKRFHTPFGILIELFSRYSQTIYFVYSEKRNQNIETTRLRYHL